MRELNALSEVEQRLARCKVKQRFQMILANISRVQIYWSPTKRRLIARATSCVRRFSVPTDAVLVGTYQHPFNSNDFLDDLDDVLRTLAISNSAAAACTG